MENKQTVAIIGLGYVGLPLAVRCAERGYAVVGLDINADRVHKLNAGEVVFDDPYLRGAFVPGQIQFTSEPADLAPADIILICVPTPIDHKYMPDLTPVVKACEMIAKYCKKGALVVLESTVNPYVSEEVVKPIFEKAGFTVGTDLYISHCPERINPGDVKWNVTNIPRVVGSFDAKGLEISLAFYRSIVDAEVRPMKSIREAEAVKILENSFRNVNIAFVNEIAQGFDKMGIDTKDVIDGAATKPFAFMAHYPSCGVGGHCIPVDPYYLVERAKESGFSHDFLKLALEINNNMPEYTVEKLGLALNTKERSVKGTRIGVLGLAYKANVADNRESPSYEIVHLLQGLGATVETFDPFIIEESSQKSLSDLLENSDALVICTNHRQFLEELTPDLLEKHRILAVVDGKNCLDKDLFSNHSFVYTGIGR
jgi:UDP-N-acetyl-D-glucosamine dehydrogenase